MYAAAVMVACNNSINLLEGDCAVKHCEAAKSRTGIQSSKHAHMNIQYTDTYKHTYTNTHTMRERMTFAEVTE